MLPTSPDEIADVVASQLAALLSRCPAFSSQTAGEPSRDLLDLMGPASRAVLLAKADFWEFDLLAALLDDYYAESATRFKELERRYEITAAAAKTLDDPTVIERIAEIFQESSQRLVDNLLTWSVLINQTLPDALGPPGRAGDPAKLVFAARMVCDVYCACLDEALAMGRYRHTRPVEDLTKAYIEMLAAPLDYLARMPTLWRENVARLRNAVAAGSTNFAINLVVPTPSVDAVSREIQKLKSRLGG